MHLLLKKLSNIDCPNLLNTTYATLCNCVAEDFSQNFPSYGDQIRSCYINRQETENGSESHRQHPKELSQFQIKTPASSNGLEAEGLRIQLQTEMCQQAPLNSCDKPFYELIRQLCENLHLKIR
uniref:Uncharacterized protein n=1 Tax=Romanomermis culicivorax TaxID=13658 RepID=A0A915KUW3_ROMCU